LKMALKLEQFTHPFGRGRQAIVIGGGVLILLVLLSVHIAQGAANINIPTILDAIFAPDDSIQHDIVRHLRLPRAAVGVLAGAGFAIAGALVQASTRNPLASETTLGINAGAYLALIVFVVFAPTLPAELSFITSLSGVLVAFLGGIAAALLVYAIAAGIQVTPVRLVLAGIAVAMVFGALTSALLIFFNEQTRGVLFWGAGSLIQNDWRNASFAWPLIVGAGTLAFLIGRKMDLLLLGDDMAQSLGIKAQRMRLSATFIAVFLTAVSVSIVGPIGFVGLVAPHLVRLMGVTKQRPLMVGAAVWGGIVIVGADVAARILSGGISELPAGTITAVIGAPFLLWLARRATMSEGAKPSSRDVTLRIVPRGNMTYAAILATTIVLLGTTVVLGIVFGSTQLTIGQLVDTFTGNGTSFTDKVIFDLRMPRIFVAGLAGASLAVSGLLLQGIVRNSLAAPDIIGITSGAALMAVAFIVLIPNSPFGSIQLFALIGAFVAFAIVYLSSWQRHGGIQPMRLALVGISISAFASSIINVIVIKADVVAAAALIWLAGSTHARGWDELSQLVAWPLILVPLAWMIARKLDIMALGDDLGKALGLSLERTRFAILIIAVSSTAAAVSVVGTLGFVGLVAPHMARILVGNHHRKLVPLAAVMGAILVVVADTIGRIVLAPSEIPSGIVTALIGTPYFLWLLWRSKSTHD
jgi:ABC-type Fe3+-siderophore transport system permease subunit